MRKIKTARLFSALFGKKNKAKKNLEMENENEKTGIYIEEMVENLDENEELAFAKMIRRELSTLCAVAKAMPGNSARALAVAKMQEAVILMEEDCEALELEKKKKA